MRHFPAFLDLRGRTVLLLGSGEVAARKAEPLRRAGAVIRQADVFAADLLDGIVLAVGADAAEEELRALSAAAQARGIPVNVVDKPALCSFITPAIIDRAPVTVAVSTGGAAPVLARMIRQRIEALLPPGIGTLAALAERFQAAIRARLPELAARRRFLDAALAGAPAELALAERVAEAEAAFAQALEAAEATPPGIVHLVGAGPGAADLLTLRALRLMGEADVILHDAGVSPAVLEMARRDAERIAIGDAAPPSDITALLRHLAQAGRRVVLLTGGDPARGAAPLQAAGIAHEVVPGVASAGI